MTTTQKTKSELYTEIERILNHFDFAAVQRHMQQVGWTWYSSSGNRVPSIDSLRNTAADLLYRLVDSEKPIYRIGTGGFQAVQFPWGIELFFAIQRS